MNSFVFKAVRLPDETMRESLHDYFLKERALDLVVD